MFLGLMQEQIQKTLEIAGFTLAAAIAKLFCVIL